VRDGIVELLAWPGRIARRLHSLVGRSAFERDMHDEMRFHIEMEAAELRRSGIEADEAMRRARLTFGAIEAHKESGREASGVRPIETLTDDVRHAWRQLGARKGFTAAVVVTLALGIGATTIMHALTGASAMQPLPYPHSHQLLDVAQVPKGCNNCIYMTSGSFVTLQQRAKTLASVALGHGWTAIVRGSDRAEALNGEQVTPDFFRTLGARALLGRTLGPADTVIGHRDVVVMSETLWRTRYGADSSLVGRAIVINGAPFAVIGVVAGETVYPLHTDVWAPLIVTPGMAADHHWTNYDMIARVADGVPVSRVRAEFASIADAEARAYPDDMQGSTFDPRPLAFWNETNTNMLWIFSAAVGLVLLIACINLAGLLLAQLASRRRELAVRAAMGAGPRRIARQLLTETLLVASLGGATGALVAWGGIAGIRAIMPSDISGSMPGWSLFRLDLPTLALALGIGIGTGLVIGVWPAVRFARPDLVKELHAASRTITDRAVGRRLLVGMQVAFGVVLLSAAGLLARSVQRVYSTPAGIAPDHVLAFRIQSPPYRPGTVDDSTSEDRLARALEAVPGVQSAGVTFALPFSDAMSTNNFDVVGQPAPAPHHHPYARMQPATPDYFATLGIPIVRGRAFSPSDAPGAPRVAIVNQAMARRFFPNADPLGQTLMIGGEQWQIVGVSGNVMYGQLGQLVTPEIYRPMQQWPWSDASVVVRTLGDPAAAEPAILAAVRRFDPDIAVSRMSPLAEGFRTVLAPYWIMLGLMGGFAVIAMLISAIGLYAVISYSVAQRTREFGVRMALGAEPGRLLRLVLGQGLRLTAFGGAVGFAAALAAAPLLRSLLYGVSPSDPLTYALVAVGASVIGIVASYRPARRAAATDPMISLQAD
jgi:putative ABC transport system permease protein